jgi:hypothetical protein
MENYKHSQLIVRVCLELIDRSGFIITKPLPSTILEEITQHILTEIHKAHEDTSESALNIRNPFTIYLFALLSKKYNNELESLTNNIITSLGPIFEKLSLTELEDLFGETMNALNSPHNQYRSSETQTIKESALNRYFEILGKVSEDYLFYFNKENSGIHF